MRLDEKLGRYAQQPESSSLLNLGWIYEVD